MKLFTCLDSDNKLTLDGESMRLLELAGVKTSKKINSLKENLNFSLSREDKLEAAIGRFNQLKDKHNKNKAIEIAASEFRLDKDDFIDYLNSEGLSENEEAQELFFEYPHRKGTGFSFTCNKDGEVDVDSLPPKARENYKNCITGKVDGVPVMAGVIKSTALNEWIVYDDNPIRGPYKGKITPYDELDANKFFLRHYENMMYLDFFFKNAQNFQEKAQANKEIGIARQKMDHWKKHPNFDREEVERAIVEIKKRWSDKKTKTTTGVNWIIQNIRKPEEYWNKPKAKWDNSVEATVFDSGEKEKIKLPNGGKWVKPSKPTESLYPENVGYLESDEKPNTAHEANVDRFVQRVRKAMKAGKEFGEAFNDATAPLKKVRRSYKDIQHDALKILKSEKKPIKENSGDPEYDEAYQEMIKASAALSESEANYIEKDLKFNLVRAKKLGDKNV